MTPSVKARRGSYLCGLDVRPRMGQLSERLAEILRKYGADPAAHQADLHQLASLEQHDPKEALARFHELKRAAAVHRRGSLLHELRTTGIVSDVPTHGVQGMDAKEIEREIRTFTRALHLARDVLGSVRGAEEAASRLRERTAAWEAAAFRSLPLDGLAAAAEQAEHARRALAREARVADRADAARRRERKLTALRVEVPDVSSARVPDAADADALLEACEARLAEAERVEEAHERVARPLRDPAVARWKGNSRKRLVEEARQLLALDDRTEAARRLDALAPQAERLRAEAARASEEASRARRSGRSGPSREPRPGDSLDGYA